MLNLAPVADLTIQVGEPIEIGTTVAGFRRLIPIVGGEVRGPRLNGRVLPGGADCQVIRTDGVLELRAQYVIETPELSRILIDNSGVRRGPEEAMERLRRGEVVDPSLIYFRTSPRFETGDPNYQWLTRSLFIATGARRPDRVELAFFEVL
ncbi:MAG TPA: DUF3237 domain-containing protein [Bryobacteraceae bacterium]|nr:DUF3237 domain-containing protein [Bryobacteraceae bacterium]